MKNNIIAGLDLGTTKVSVLIAEQSEGGLNILGFSSVKSEGLNRGLVANIAKTAEAINKAVGIASNRAGVEITSVNVGVAGEHITSLRHRNYVTISNPEKEIKAEDIIRLKDDVKTLTIPSDKQILHIIPEEFIVDNQPGIEDPIGMCGGKLEAVNHVVLASIPAIQNIKKAVERAGYSVNKYILQPIASCLSVLDENEQDLGVILIDIGGGTTDVAIYHNKSVKHTKVFGVAGNQVTRDIRESLGIVTEDAEMLKIDYGYATEDAIIKDEDILIKGVGARGNIKVPISLLTQIISIRMRELFILIDADIKNSGLKNKIKAGVVLTGGGSLLRGCVELAEEIFGLPARMGVPLELKGKLPADIEKPEFATVAGLIKGFPGLVEEESKPQQVEVNPKKKETKSPVGSLYKKFREFFDEL